MKRIVALLLSLFLLASAPLAGMSGLFSTAAKAEKIYSVGDTVEFGSYPQSEVTDSKLISKLTSKAGSTDKWISYNYYINSKQSDFMKYKDISYKGEKYRGVYFSSYRPDRTSYSSSEDYSYQDDNGFYTSDIYWFRYEPVSWTVFDADAGFIVSNLVLDSQEYYDSYSDRTIDGKTVYSNNWEYSNIRKWLNDDFYNTAFTAAEQNAIRVTPLSNVAYSTDFSKYDANNTEDKVVALTYAFATKYWTNAADRIAKNTDYAKCQGAFNNSNAGTSYYWLCSAGGDASYSSYVNYSGDVNSSCRVYSTYIGVRPAIRIDLSALVTQSEKTDSGERLIIIVESVALVIIVVLVIFMLIIMKKKKHADSGKKSGPVVPPDDYPPIIQPSPDIRKEEPEPKTEPKDCYCGECGKQFIPGQLFCTNCGTPLK